MALHDLKIIVVDGGKAESTMNLSGGGSGAVEGGENAQKSGKNSTLYKVLNFNQTIRSKVQQALPPAAGLAVQQGIGLAVQTGREFINYYVNDIGRRNGDSNYQAIVNRRIEKFTDVASVGMGALSGAASGSVLGPVGAVVGALAGATSAVISNVFKYREREREYQHEMFKENTSQAYQLARANYSVYTGRVR